MSQVYIHRPEILYPQRQMKNVLPTLPIRTTPFRPVKGITDTHITTQIQVHNRTIDKIILTTEIDPTPTDIQNVADLESFQEYRLRVRYKGKTHGWSAWSVWTSFTTCDRAYTPHILSPSQNQKNITSPFTIKISLPQHPYQYTQHSATQYQISHTLDFTDIIYDSGLSPDLTSHRLFLDFDPKTKYHIRVRQYRHIPDQPTSVQVSDWAYKTFTTNKKRGDHLVTEKGITWWPVPENVTQIHVALQATGTMTSSVGPILSASQKGSVGHDGLAKETIQSSHRDVYVVNAVPVNPGQVIPITLGDADSFAYITWGYPKFTLR